jgi:hypothetical protein
MSSSLGRLCLSTPLTSKLTSKVDVVKTDLLLELATVTDWLHDLLAQSQSGCRTKESSQTSSKVFQRKFCVQSPYPYLANLEYVRLPAKILSNEKTREDHRGESSKKSLVSHFCCTMDRTKSSGSVMRPSGP